MHDMPLMSVATLPFFLPKNEPSTLIGVRTMVEPLCAWLALDIWLNKIAAAKTQ
jgi:hypothetical protein